MPRRAVNLYEAKTSLSRLVEQAAGGKEIVIAKAGVPKAKLVPIRNSPARRIPGAWNGKVWVADDFDAPLPPEILTLFEGGRETR